MIPGLEHAQAQFKAQARSTEQQRDVSTEHTQVERKGQNAWILEYMDQESSSDDGGSKVSKSDSFSTRLFWELIFRLLNKINAQNLKIGKVK